MAYPEDKGIEPTAEYVAELRYALRKLLDAFAEGVGDYTPEQERVAGLAHEALRETAEEIICGGAVPPSLTGERLQRAANAGGLRMGRWSL